MLANLLHICKFHHKKVFPFPASSFETVVAIDLDDNNDGNKSFDHFRIREMRSACTSWVFHLGYQTNLRTHAMPNSHVVVETNATLHIC